MRPEEKDPSKRPEASFDERLARLEAIVGELEGGKLGLEPAIARYQEGVELLKHCQRQLAGLRARVLELGKEAEGALTPFDGDPDDRARS